MPASKGSVTEGSCICRLVHVLESVFVWEREIHASQIADRNEHGLQRYTGHAYCVIDSGFCYRTANLEGLDLSPDGVQFR